MLKLICQSLFRIVGFLLLFYTLPVQSQEYDYIHFGINDGLPSSQVYDIFQASNGNLWFATDRGLARYNGYEFESYGLEDGIPGLAVLDFYPQSNGQIWCATNDRKLFYFEEAFNGFFEYAFNESLNFLYDNMFIEGLFVDEQGQVHMGATNFLSKLRINANGHAFYDKNAINKDTIFQGKYVINEAQNEDRFLSYLAHDTLINNHHIRASTIASSKFMAISLGRDQPSIFLRNRDVIILNKSNESPIVISNEYEPISIGKITEDIFFIGYRYGGIHIVGSDGNVLDTFLNGKEGTRFLIDHQGGYWFATRNSGVYYLRNRHIGSIDLTQNEVPVASLTTGNNSTIYIGCQDSKIFELKNRNSFKQIYESEINKDASVVSYDQKEDKLYFSTIDSTNLTWPNSKLARGLSSANISEYDKDIQLISNINGWLHIKKNGRYENKLMPFRIQDASYWNDTIFLGTQKGLFTLYNDSVYDVTKNASLLKYRIEDIDASQERLYLATIGGGLLVYSNGDVFQISKKEGLYSTIVNEVYVENNQEIWLGTNQGVNKVTFNDHGNYSISGINNENGLKSNEVNDLIISNDTLWVGTSKGLTYVPKKLFDSVATPKKFFLQLKSIIVNDQPYSKDEFHKLKYNQNKVSFTVEGISFSDQRLVYTYNLQGLNEKWATTTNRKIDFLNLPPGRYTFKVMACNTSMNCDEDMTTYSFVISLPYWKTLWFRLTSLLLIGGFIYLFFKFRVLTYNKDIIRELIRLWIRKLKQSEKYIIFKEAGNQVRIKTNEILYVKSSGNYIEIVTKNDKHTVRAKIGEFITSSPDPLEYIRIHRSYIIRLDKVHSKSRNSVVINNKTIIVGRKYLPQLGKIQF